MVKIKDYEFSIGADPELFVTNNGKLVSAYGLVPGTKEAPFKVKHGAVQVDGMALEFNIDPAFTFSEFERNITSTMNQMKAMLPEGYEFLIEPVAEFGAEYIEAQPKEAKELGCNPDFNAYTRKENPRPDANMPFRTASGHLHIGWTNGVDPYDKGHLEACYALVKSLDSWIGIPSLVWDADDKRRSLYGQAGAFRPKHYGLEYRVPSNMWLVDPVFRKTVYYNTIEAIKHTFANPAYGDNRQISGHIVGEAKGYSITIRELINLKKEEFNTKIYWDAIKQVFFNLGVRAPNWYRTNKV